MRSATSQLQYTDGEFDLGRYESGASIFVLALLGATAATFLLPDLMMPHTSLRLHVGPRKSNRSFSGDYVLRVTKAVPASLLSSIPTSPPKLNTNSQLVIGCGVGVGEAVGLAIIV